MPHPSTHPLLSPANLAGLSGGHSPFAFDVPITGFEKAKEESTGRDIVKIRGVASTNDLDLDGHTLEPVGFDSSYFLENGHFNYNHQAKLNPAANIGEPTKAEVRLNDQGRPEYWVEGFLYADHPLAEQVVSHMETLQKNKSRRKMRFSIEGKPIEVDPDNKNRVTRTLITGIALTTTPKNAKTYAELVKALGNYPHPDDQPGPAYVAARIYDAVPDVTPSQVRRISALVDTLATQPNAPRMENPTLTLDQNIDKAFSLLGLEKGKVTAPQNDPEPDENEEEEEEEDDDDEPQDEQLEKAIGSATAHYAKGLKKSFIIKGLMAEGFDADTAQDAYALARTALRGRAADPAEQRRKSLAESITTKRAELAELEKSFAEVGGAINPAALSAVAPAAGAPAAAADMGELLKGFDDKFKSVGLLLGEVLAKLSGTETTLHSTQQQLQELASTSPGPKTLLTKSFTDRPFQQAPALEKGLPTMSVSNPQHRAAILDQIEAKVNWDNLEEPHSKRYHANMLSFENTGQLEKSVADELQREGGYTLIN